MPSSIRSALEMMPNGKRRESVVGGSPVAQNRGVVGTLSVVTGAGPPELNP